QCSQQIPGMERRKNQAVSPIRGVLHQPPSRRSPDERAQLCHRFDFRVFLEITKGGRRMSPAIKSDDWPDAVWSGLQQDFIPSHVLCWFSTARLKKTPTFLHEFQSAHAEVLPADGQRALISQPKQSGPR